MLSRPLLASLDSLLTSTHASLAAPLSLLAGAASCFFGYRLFTLMLGLYGLTWGGVFGLALAEGSGLEGGGALALVLIVAALGAWLSLAFYLVGVFMIGASAGALFMSTLATALQLEIPGLAILGTALLVGAVAIKLQRALIILSTAYSGAWIMLLTLGALTQRERTSLALVDWSSYTPIWPTLDASPMAVLILWLGLGAVGAMVQLSTAKR
jgi:hypothetical protein